MRKNRRDLDNEVHDMVWQEPAAFTRASRRAAGYRKGVHVDAMRAFHADNTVMPRAIRRLMRDPATAHLRMNAAKAKVNRLLAPYGVHL